MQQSDMTTLRPDPDALVDFSPFDDDQMRLLAAQVRTEVDRRAQVERAPQIMQDMLVAKQSELGEPGDPWVKPTHALNSYPYGWLVTHEGKTWLSTTPGNVHEPGVSGWREQVPEGQPPPAWDKPSGAHDAYMIGERVTHNGQVWFCTIDGNGHEPGVSGWALEDPPDPEPDPGTGAVPWQAGMTYSAGGGGEPADQVSYDGIAYNCRQTHTSQVGWEPPNLPALWLKI